METQYLMIGYIHENGAALNRTLEDNEASVRELAEWARSRTLERIILTGIGSSWTAIVAARLAYEKLVDIPTVALPATELPYYGQELVNERTLPIVVSRSGERGYVVSALQRMAGLGAETVAMTGVADSLLAQEADRALITGEGPEITYPKTKSVISCMGLLIRLALELSSHPAKNKLLEELKKCPQYIEETVAQTEPAVKAVVDEAKGLDKMVIAATGANIGAAEEGALKIQETAFLTTRAQDTGNLLHGYLCDFSEGWLITLLISEKDLRLSKETLRVLKALGARTLCITDPDLELDGLADHQIALPLTVSMIFEPLLFLPPLQLMTYYWTVTKGLNPDAPSTMRTVLDAILPPGREEPEFRK